ncbi:MAG: hypothetical protein QNJ85_07355 [Gammaproteobacteria bacterium]|nr:hypothetical protein [Gammaproteobacteria bacterium]
MKQLLLSLLLLLPLTLPALDLQVLTVDERHIQIGHDNGEQGDFYAIESASEIEIDATGYDFRHYEGMQSNQPNLIQVVIDDERQYFVRWQAGVTRYRLNRSTMVPRAREFDGFMPGDRFVIAIGQLGLDAASEQVFMVQWAGIGEVQR